MGVHQRQRPVPKGHATRPKIIVLLGYFSVRKKRTRLLATIFRYTSTAPLCDFCHSFLFFYQSCISPLPPLLALLATLLLFCNLFVAVFLKVTLLGFWWELDTFAFWKQGSTTYFLLLQKSRKKMAQKTSWTEGRKLKSCQSHSVWKSWSLCYH